MDLRKIRGDYSETRVAGSKRRIAVERKSLKDAANSIRRNESKRACRA